MKLTLKEIDIVKLAQKISSGEQGAPELMLLDRIHELEQKASKLKQEIVTFELQIESQLKNVQLKQGPRGIAGKDGKNGIDGKNGRDGRDGTDGKNGLDGKDGNIKELSSEEIRDSLELLQGNERLDKTAIKGLDEEIRRIENRPMGTGARQRVFVKDVTSQCDGSNKTFTTGGTHFGIIGVFGTEFPLIYRPIIDYTVTATGILLTSAVSAPATNQTLLLQFIK